MALISSHPPAQTSVRPVKLPAWSLPHIELEIGTERSERHHDGADNHEDEHEAGGGLELAAQHEEHHAAKDAAENPGFAGGQDHDQHADGRENVKRNAFAGLVQRHR